MNAQPSLPAFQSLSLLDAEATARLGEALAALLRAGDTVLLDGHIGAGKTHLARAIIQARLARIGRVEDVPSPTFTLVQVYEDADGEIWHADLYRLSSPAEVDELGLTDAFGAGLCLIEWPDRLGGHLPENPLHIALELEGDGRSIRFMGGGDWPQRLAGLAV